MTAQSGRIRIDTLGKTREGRYTLAAHCNNTDCGHRAELDLDALIEKLGAGHSSLAGDLVPKLHCSRCRGKRLSLSLSPPTGYDAWRERR